MKKFWDVGFPEPLITKLHFDDTIEIYEDFYGVWVDQLHRLNAIRVPAGFMYDGPSVPKGFQWYASKIGNHSWASTIHDWIYDHKGKVTVEQDGQPVEMTFTRKEADRLFYMGLKARGIRMLKAWLIYMAVRVGGGKTWRT